MTRILILMIALFVVAHARADTDADADAEKFFREGEVRNMKILAETNCFSQKRNLTPTLKYFQCE